MHGDEVFLQLANPLDTGVVCALVTYGFLGALGLLRLLGIHLRAQVGHARLCLLAVAPGHGEGLAEFLVFQVFLFDLPFEFFDLDVKFLDLALGLCDFAPEARGFIRFSLIVFDAHAACERKDDEE